VLLRLRPFALPLPLFRLEALPLDAIALLGFRVVPISRGDVTRR
jgi:hypothetical protein